MSKFEERLQEKIPKAAKIHRGLRQTAGIIDETPLDDFEACSLQKIYETWETLMTNKYIKDKEELRKELADVRTLGMSI